MDNLLPFYLILVLVSCFAHLFAVVAQSTPPITSRITVVGSVYCDTCYKSGFSSYSYFMPGVDVNVQCKFNAKAPRTTEMISIAVNRSTDSRGVYKVMIPSVDGVDCIDGPPIQAFCQATLIGTSSAACNVPGLKATTGEISMKSRSQYMCVYSFTPLSFRPVKRNNTLCKLEAGRPSNAADTSKFLLPPNYP